MLYQFVEQNREEIIRRCRAKVATRPDPPCTAAEIDHGVPLFLEQLADALHRRLSSTPEIATTAVLRGDDMLRRHTTMLSRFAARVMPV